MGGGAGGDHGKAWKAAQLAGGSVPKCCGSVQKCYGSIPKCCGSVESVTDPSQAVYIFFEMSMLIFFSCFCFCWGERAKKLKKR